MQLMWMTIRPCLNYIDWEAHWETKAKDLFSRNSFDVNLQCVIVAWGGIDTKRRFAKKKIWAQLYVNLNKPLNGIRKKGERGI